MQDYNSTLNVFGREERHLRFLNDIQGNVVLKPLCNWTAFTTACFIQNEGGPKGK